MVNFHLPTIFVQVYANFGPCLILNQCLIAGPEYLFNKATS
jgi:hypothetical protein